jgi:predicted dinucleotide-utilizing enzyme
MTRTVDLVVAGQSTAARAAAVSALQRGHRVLVVLRNADTRVARGLRRWLRTTPGAPAGRLWIMSGAEVVCADGVGDVEAVVIRYERSRRLCAVNASAFVSFEGPPESVCGDRTLSEKKPGC